MPRRGGSGGRLYEDNGITPTEGHPLDRGLQFGNNFPTTNTGGGGGGGGGGIPPVGGKPPAPNAPGTGTTPTGTPPPGGPSAPPFNPLDWFKDPGNIAGLAGLIASFMGGNGQEADPRNTEELRRIQAITEAKMRRVDPLHQAVSALAFSRLPVSARQGITYQNTPLPPEQT